MRALFPHALVARLRGVQLVVCAALGHQFVMRACFHDTLIANVQDAVAVLDGGQAVRNDEGRASLQQRLNAVLQQLLRLGVDGGGCLVQYQDARSLSSVRAKAISCFCPCERLPPRSFTVVL